MNNMWNKSFESAWKAQELAKTNKQVQVRWDAVHGIVQDVQGIARRCWTAGRTDWP